MNAEEKKTVELALGRIFRMGSRPTQPGDVEEWERCRAIILNALSPSTPFSYVPATQPNWVRDRLKGSAGD